MKKITDSPSLPKSERLCRMLDISPEALPYGYSAEIQGRSLVKVRGGGKILLYTASEIKISLPKKGGVLSVKGCCLSCSSYNRGALGIEGKIRSLDFEDADAGKGAL